MRPIFTRLTKLILLVLLPGFLFGQSLKDYSLQLTSGKYLPEENRNSVTKQSDVFQRSLYSGKHYVTIQFTAIPDQVMKSRLSAAGIELMDYIPNYAYTASVSENFDLNAFKSFPIRSIVQFSIEQKTPASFYKGIMPPHAVKQAGYVDVTVTTYEKISVEKITASLNAIGAAIIADNQIFKNYDIRVPIANTNLLAGLAFIQWAEPIEPPHTLENAQGRSLHRVNILNDGARNLKGDGINIGIWDGGQINLTHLDFSPAGRVTTVRAGAVSDHATHVAGTITGKGIVNPVAQGMAPNARLFSWDFNTNIQTEMAAEVPGRNLLVSSHSYGSSGTPSCSLNDPLGTYNTTSRNTDINLNNNGSHLHVHSSGNSGGVCSGGFMTITGSGKSAKNNLVVSNVTTTEAISGSSSRGPVQDGRIKPEISAMGTNVFSTWIPNNTYATISGTSMATPEVSGTAALLYQRYKQLNGNSDPSSALIKNVICNAALDIGNPGPDYTFGFGRIDALSSVEILESAPQRYAVNTVTNGNFNDVTITVPAGTVLLKAMLTWNDPAGAANANPALVNDLDLSVINGATTTLPWIMDKNNPGVNATRGVDNYSNIEQVTITNPTAGTYTLKVNGTNVTTGPNQQYALTWIIEQAYIEILFPNGGETLIPGTASGQNIQYITWNSAGVTSNQTVEYSTDNGGSWNTIATVGPTVTRQVWNPIPSVSTSIALVRVTSGSISDVSDANFSIMGLPILQVVTTPACNAGEISYTWTAVSGATHYDIYRLDPATGNFSILASNIVGTGHTITGLTPGNTIWAALVAKNNTTNAISPRSNAVSGVVSTGGGGLSPIGSVSGQSTVCGNLQNVQYSVPTVTGATSYTWTTPPNTTIASGQGTSTIFVNFFAGSSSGNVTVFASAGSCQTTTSTFPVTFSSEVLAPVSGGDQTSNVCPPTPIPTLTATATIPPGHTLTWFTAATGGSVVASPTLSTPGTVTYHAQSTNNSSGCVSATRTAVTLTINSVSAASITANGPITFCQGGSVILTANAGTSYLWNNGATSQAITVTTGGSYSVTVTTGSCVNTSPATTVTVNPVPAAVITAGGPLTFCQGLNVVLTASAGSSWLWSNGATTQAITVTSSGNYSVVVTNVSNCSATSAATTVVVNPNPAAVITAGGPITFCNGGSVVLTANAGASYLWSNGATTQSITVSSPVGTTNYSVNVTQAGGCVSSSGNTAVTINALPAATITAGGALAFCNGGNVVLSAPAGASWIWRNGATQVATSQNYTATASGTYTVQVTTAAGCTATSTVTNVAVSPNPVATLAAAPFTKLFPGLKTTLTATVTPPGTYTYTWLRNGLPVPNATTATIPNIDLNGLGSYIVTVTNTTGLPCSNTSNAVVIADSVSAKLFVYPNPSDGDFQIQYYTTNVSAHTISIFDARGTLVYRKAYTLSIPYQQMDVDIRRHGAGVYQVVLHDKNGKRLAIKQIVVAQK